MLPSAGLTVRIDPRKDFEEPALGLELVGLVTCDFSPPALGAYISSPPIPIPGTPESCSRLNGDGDDDDGDGGAIGKTVLC